MTIGMEKYEELLHEFGVTSQNFIDNEAFKSLKNHYKDEIPSRRVFERIDDVYSLLKELDRCGILKYNDIRVLEHINQNYANNERVQRLICDYKNWLGENTSIVNYLYNSGKSYHSLTKNSCKSQESNEECLENLIPKIQVTNNAQQSTHNNSLIIFKFCQCSKICKKRRYIILFLIIFIISLIMIGIACTLVKLYYNSTAVPSESQAVAGSSGANMPYHTYINNLNVGITNEYRNYTQYYQTSRPKTALERERELQKLVIDEISERIGSTWADICRYLDVQESKIETIEIQYFKGPQSYEKMFKEAISIYFSKPQPNWKTAIIDALDFNRRSGLKERIKKILYENS